MSGFFNNFQVIPYANNNIVNILERIAPLKSDFTNPYLFYPHDVENGERADQLANKVYNDPFQTWVLYLMNGIVDPYYQWYLASDDFEAFLRKKYNVPTSDLLQNKIMFYRNNWPIDEQSINLSTFNALDPSLWKFYTAVYGNSSDQPIYYVRSQDDTIVNTNLIYQYTSNVANFALIENEIVDVVFSPSYVGHGQVLVSNSSSVMIQHCSGVLNTNATVTIANSTVSHIYGHETKSNTQFTTANLVASNIPPLEVVFYEPVSVYDYETEQNEQNKSMLILNPSYNKTISTQLNALLK